MNPRGLRVGLTGGIASGKSTVAALFGALGVPIVDADVIAREVVAVGQPVLGQIAGRFGAGVLAGDGSLDRAALRELVFKDPQARKDLEALTHPQILIEMQRQAAAAAGPYVMLAIPLLVEKDAARLVDRVLVVDCDEESQIRRLQARDGSTRALAEAILAAQAPRAVRLQAADDIILNAADLHSLRDQVAVLHASYLQLAPAVYGQRTPQAE